jgi:hypothetical protein
MTLIRVERVKGNSLRYQSFTPQLTILILMLPVIPSRRSPEHVSGSLHLIVDFPLHVTSGAEMNYNGASPYPVASCDFQSTMQQQATARAVTPDR